MQNDIKKSNQIQQPRQVAYEPPRVQNLGAWQAVTLINSVPINPASIGGLTGWMHPAAGEDHEG